MSAQKIITALLLSVFLLFSAGVSAENAVIDDGVITTKIKSKILMDPSLSVLKVDVSTNNGIVTLSGNVNSDTDAAAAVQIAQSTDGVTDVNASQLSIKNSQHPVTDTTITAKVKGMFIKEKLFSDKDVAAMSISVETTDGVVYLSGKADSQQQIDNAIKIAKSVNGVKNVESRVEVR